LLSATLIVALLLLAQQVPAEPSLPDALLGTLQPGDRIAVVGGGLADRMQHDGWLETYLQARLPEHQLAVRHLGFTGDELTLRMRSVGFGTPEQWLDRAEANVVFACFGYNESFRDQAGLADFRKNLTQFVRVTRQPAQGAARRVVLFSPIAYEDLGDPLLPSAGELNRRLAGYTTAIAEVANQLEVPFVDLYHPSLSAYQHSSEPLTINGIHLNAAGNRAIGQIAAQALAGLNTTDEATLANINAAVCDKNFYWFHRYRTTDGYSIFGKRKGTGGSRWTPENEPVMQREMKILDQLTANRDQQIWSLAQGKPYTLDDSNTPPPIPVATNKPGPLDDGAYPFLSGEEAIAQMDIAPGLEVNLFASEETFPELQNPVQAAVDTKGRLWAAVWPSYPHWKPKDEMNDKLLIFEDTDGDGRADKCKTFADGLHNPTGFEFYNGGVYVAQIPDIWFFKDTDGDDVADVRERVIGGIDSADTHHSINSFVIGPGGGLYFQEGTFHQTQVETPHGPPVRNANAGVFRYDPISQDFSVYAGHNFANPHGHVFTYWGDDIVHDGTGAIPYFGPAISGHVNYPGKHWYGPTVYQKRTRPCPATAILSSAHFPESQRDTLLVCNVIGVQGILQYRLEDQGGGLQGTEIEPLLTSQDPNFRPVDMEIGQDGALYVLDWQNPLIGHLQHNLRDASRDHRHGRIYRVHHQERPLLEPTPIAGEPLDQLCKLLEQRDNGLRYRAKIELSSRPRLQVVAACQQWLEGLDPESENYEHHLLEGLWVHQLCHVPNEPLLRQLLGSSDHRVRAAAGGVLRTWREQIPESLALTEQLVHDAHPRVRLAGVLLASDLDSLRGAELALEAARQPGDKFLDYALVEALKTLTPHWRRQLAAGLPLCEDNRPGIRSLLKASSPESLLGLGKHPLLAETILTAPDLKEGLRTKALNKLAKLRDTAPCAMLLDTLETLDNAPEQLVALLATFENTTLSPIVDRLEQLATEGQKPLVRQAALAAWMRVAPEVDTIWQQLGGSTDGVLDLLAALEQIPSAKLRARFYERVRPLVLDPQQAKAQTAAIRALAQIPGHEDQKLDDLLHLLEENRSRADVVEALQAIDAAHWSAAQAEQLVPLSIDYLATVSQGDRASGAAYQELQLALRLAEQLPPKPRDAALTQLRSLGVVLLAINTIPHRMAYDQQQLVVQTKGPIQLVFKNQDDMPHNWVLVQPGSLESIGKKAEAEATKPAAIARHHVPNHRNVLLGSRLLQPGETQTLDFLAPEKPGVYPFVCTYPGHWRRMFGALVVVKNLEQYEADPDGYLAANKIVPRDDLLKFNRPLKEWTFAELEPALDRLAQGRSHLHGAQLFQTASCAACHTVAEGQRRFAPDLAKLDPKRTPADILHSIVTPSKEIGKEYQMHQFLLDSGKVVVGLITEEDAKEVTLLIDPLVTCNPTIVNKDEIEERYQSELSLMPSGLLDRFTEEEILELCAYVVARCNPAAAIYQESE
jgi:putative heme-binding domain-containing protein